MADLKDILNQEDEPNNEELMKYLKGNASEEERIAIEKQMADSSFMNDAVEGLQHFKDPVQVNEYVEQLNKQLHNHTTQKLLRKKKRKLKDQNWLVIAILAILLLCVTGYLLIHFYSRHN
jgi:membrane-bound ClpP family serine protease